MAEDDDGDGGFTFTTREENAIEGIPEDVQRFWDKMYRICAKEIVSQDRQFDSRRSKQQLEEMVENVQLEPAVRLELQQQQKKVANREKQNKFLLNECFSRYMVAYKIFQEVSQPNFYEELEKVE